MKEEARARLEWVIEQLDKDVRSVEQGSWVSEFEKEARSGDEESLRTAYVAIRVILSAQQGRQNAVFKVLVGENRLTPSLTNRGWQFWKQPLLTKKQRKAVESAVIRWSEASVARSKVLQEDYAKLTGKDLHSAVICLASVLDSESACRQQLSADLKATLVNSTGS